MRNIFWDNKASHDVHLEKQFTHIHLDDFPNISAYSKNSRWLLIVCQMLVHNHSQHQRYALLYSSKTDLVIKTLVTVVFKFKFSIIQHTTTIMVKNDVRIKNNNCGINGGCRGRHHSNNSHKCWQQYNPRPCQQQKWSSYFQWGRWEQQPWVQGVLHHKFTFLMCKFLQIMHLLTSMLWFKICPWMFLMKLGTWTLVQLHTWLDLIF